MKTAQTPQLYCNEPPNRGQESYSYTSCSSFSDLPGIYKTLSKSNLLGNCPESPSVEYECVCATQAELRLEAPCLRMPKDGTCHERAGAWWSFWLYSSSPSLSSSASYARSSSRLSTSLRRAWSQRLR